MWRPRRRGGTGGAHARGATALCVHSAWPQPPTPPSRSAWSLGASDLCTDRTRRRVWAPGRRLGQARWARACARGTAAVAAGDGVRRLVRLAEQQGGSTAGRPCGRDDVDRVCTSGAESFRLGRTRETTVPPRGLVAAVTGGSFVEKESRGCRLSTGPTTMPR